MLDVLESEQLEELQLCNLAYSLPHASSKSSDSQKYFTQLNNKKNLELLQGMCQASAHLLLGLVALDAM